ncbi:hypothetical protein HP550_20035 [Cellulomonas humilata]|uniref:Uncharacterized protein n=1 Tax=Cellulomonas humilata TaxID=144055 RepID=A0A7Y6A4C7_9CELL|nr:hypothetical protein [Cellulomonas humilata]NUU19543.1 hypothetical protein [Cellulomonas humilata]
MRSSAVAVRPTRTAPPRRPRAPGVDVDLFRHGMPVTPATVLALQRSAGNRAVQRLVQLREPPRASRILSPADREAFVVAELPRTRDRRAGREVMRDMAATSNILDFGSRSELRDELVKRVTVITVMADAQVSRGGLAPFGYPFTGASPYWGPRVGYAARDHWVPPTPDGYDRRLDAAKRATVRGLPRSRRNTVFGDQGSSYQFRLSATGARDPWSAIMLLFEAQPPHKRTLVHCDYLVSLVHFRAFMAVKGKTAFNAAIAAHGPDKVVLKYDLFTELEPSVGGRPGLGSIRQVVPSSEGDLVLGDHVYFFNHPGYDLINKNVGNAWRLENAVLVARKGGADVFLGHGSGRRTHAEMRGKLAEEYNDVARIVLALVRRTGRGSAASRTAARTELGTRFPAVVQVAGAWRVVGTGMLGVAVDMPLRLLRASDVPGLFDPSNPGVLYRVRRAAESA